MNSPEDGELIKIRCLSPFVEGWKSKKQETKLEEKKYFNDIVLLSFAFNLFLIVNPKDMKNITVFCKTRCSVILQNHSVAQQQIILCHLLFLEM